MSSFPSPIIPRDVAVVDEDLLWRAELMNACRPLYSDDFAVIGEALDRIEPDGACVLVIGPNSVEASLGHIASAKDGRPNLRILIIDPEDDDGQMLSGQVLGADAVVTARGGTQQIVSEVNRLLASARADIHRTLETEGSTRDTFLIVVTSAKAGEGSTVTAVHLALTLQRGGAGQVTLVDTDPTFGDVAMRLELEPPDHQADSAPRTVSPTAVRELVVPAPDGLQVFIPPTARHELHALPPPTIPTILETLQPDADIIVLDGGFGLVQQAGLHHLADRVLLVTTPDLTNLKNATVAGGLLERADHVGAVLNRYGGGHRRSRHAELPSTREIQHAIGLPVVGVLPHSDDLADVPERRSDKDLTAAVDELAARVMDRKPFR